MGMVETWYVGPIGKLIGAYGRVPRLLESEYLG